MKTKMIISTLSCILGIVISSYAMDINYLETWSEEGTAGWSANNTEVDLFNDYSFLNIQFEEQEAPFCESSVVWTDIEEGSIPTNISFYFQAINIYPSAVRLCLVSDNGTCWYSPLTRPVSDQMFQYSVPVDYSSVIWSTGPNSTQAAWDRDIMHMVKVGIYIRRHSSPIEQNYAIDDFIVMGIDGDTDNDSDNIPDAWELRYGLDPNDSGDAVSDEDGDGMTAYEEYICDTNPHDSRSILGIGFNQVLSEGNNIQWTASDNRVYSVWKSTNLLDGFEKVASGITSSMGSASYTDSTDDRVCFYEISAENPI